MRGLKWENLFSDVMLLYKAWDAKVRAAEAMTLQTTATNSSSLGLQSVVPDSGATLRALQDPQPTPHILGV